MALGDVKVLSSVYHRNGISGLGFFAVHGSAEIDGKREEFVATVCGKDIQTVMRGQWVVDPATRVLMLDEFGRVDLERKMRGDNLHEALCAILVKSM